jgi:hypothetical protein
MRPSLMQRIALLLPGLALLACSDDPSDLGDVSLQLASHNAASVATPGTAGQLLIAVGDDEIVLDQVGLVLRKVRLEGASTEPCPEEDEGDPRCGELEFGPVLFELPLGEGAEGLISAAVPIGSYTGLKFQLHRPTNANEDAEFVADHPELEGVSIRALGTWNGEPFTFTSDLTDVESLAFDDQLEVTADGELPLTLLVEVGDWFASGEGGLVNPSEASGGGPLESLVERQIRESFRAFRDGNEDGSPD